MEGWLGALILTLSGVGWGKQVAASGVTLPMLLLTLALSGVGLALCVQAALHGSDLPLILGSTGALGVAVFQAVTPGGK